MSIYVRPVREQIEHDRVIRHLQGKLKRKFDVAANVGAEQQAAMLKTATGFLYPDLVLTSLDRSKRLAGIVEVETSESVHHLEAMAQWLPFGRLRVPFHLYVPATCADIAKRLANDLGAHVTELWTYHAIGDQIRLAVVQKTPMPSGRNRGIDAKAVPGGAAGLKPATPATPAPAEKTAAAPAKAAAPAGKAIAPAAKAIAPAAKPAPVAAKPKPAPAKPAKKITKTAKPSRAAKSTRPKSRSAKPAPRKTARKPARKPARRVAKRR